MNIRYENLPPVFRTILEKRGIIGKKAVESFLYPHLKDLPSPFQMKGMQMAVEKIASALDTGKKIVIWGDYDVDGTSGTALLITFFKSIGIDPVWHIPDRESEGYGLNLNSLRRIAEDINDFRYLLITVDCGISNQREIEEMQQWGAEAIVTDHHSIPETPPACIVINPRQDDCGFHGFSLAGVGVAFYLMAGLRSYLRDKGYFEQVEEPNLKDYLGYVALGTIADMVPLQGINRLLVSAGLEVLSKTDMPGLQALLNETGITEGRILSDDIGFQIGPTINAAGRMANAELSVRLLISQNKKEAVVLARNLISINNSRKDTCKKDLELALTLIDKNKVYTDQCCMVLGDFHHGVLGILAAKLMEMFNLPAIVLAHATANGTAIVRGSCRSPEGFDIMKILTDCSDILLAYGGHSYAAGFSIKPENVPEFSRRARSSFKSFRIAKSSGECVHAIDFSIQKALAQDHVQSLQLLEPFGKGNERPVFRDRASTVIDYRLIGKNKEHLSMTFRSDNGGCKGIGFFLGERTSILEEGRTCEVVYTINPNRFKGKLNWQLHVLDIAQQSS
jgi:single-stranded-DNA-specific exonuclease